MLPTFRPRIAAAAAVLLGIAGLAACGRAADTPVITEVRPASVAPGGLLVLSGRGFGPDAGVWLAGQPLRRVTWVTDGLLTAVVPADAAAGTYPLEAGSAGGRRARASVQIDAAPGALPASTFPPPTPTPQSSPVIQAPPQPTRVAPPPVRDRGRGGEDRDGEHDDRGQRERDRRPGQGRGRGD